MKRLSRYLIVFLVGGIVFTGASKGYSEVIKYLSINQAVDLALEESIKIKQAELAEDKSDTATSGASLLRDVAMSKYYEEADAVKKAVYANDYYNAEKNYRLASTKESLSKLATTQEKKKVELTAKQKYLDVLKSKALVDVATNQLSIAEEQLKQTNIKFKVGLVSKKDVLDAEVNYGNAQAYAKGMKSQYAIKHYSLRREIGASLSEKIIPTTQFNYQPIQDIDINDAAELIAKDSFEMEQLKEQLNTLNELKQWGKDEDFENTRAYDDIDDSIDEVNMQIDALKKDYSLAVYAAYTNLKSSEDQIKIYQKKIEAAKESLRIVKLQYKSGMATTLAVSATQAQLADLQTQYFNAIYDYNLAKTKFEEKLFF